MKMLPDISILLSLSYVRWVLLYQCASGPIPHGFFVGLCGLAWAWFPYVFPYVSPLCIPYLIPYSESIRTRPKGCSFLFGL
jgi:hypothetical protein